MTSHHHIQRGMSCLTDINGSTGALCHTGRTDARVVATAGRAIVVHSIKGGPEPFRSRANSLPGANRPIGPWPICSLSHSLPGAKWPSPFAPRNESSCYLSLPGTFVTWNFCSHNVCLITVYLCILALESITKLFW